MSLRFIPSSSHPTSTTNLSTKATSSLSAPSAPGLPDTLRSRLNPAEGPSSSINNTLGCNSTPLPPLTSSHPLEARLARWRSTQESLKMAGLRRTFGIAEPVRRGMELKIVREGEWRPVCLGGSAGVHGDVLEGRDERIDWEDIFRTREEVEGVADFHVEVEGKVRMNW
ncbi:MAG: hypothetical protein MMC33_008181 [Icmadophila ericetorum]|nr:hypothetical protein [Icmadophila ericetorum]